jgi:hypothetical protein
LIVHRGLTFQILERLSSDLLRASV